MPQTSLEAYLLRTWENNSPEAVRALRKSGRLDSLLREQAELMQDQIARLVSTGHTLMEAKELTYPSFRHPPEERDKETRRHGDQGTEGQDTET